MGARAPPSTAARVRTAAVVVALLGITTAATAAPAPRDRAQEAAIDKAVEAIDPTLVAPLHEANDAMDRGDAATAAQLYAAVHMKAPDVASVTRRLCTAEARSGALALGLIHCREALAKEDTPENHAALAVAILTKAPPMQGVSTKRGSRLAPRSRARRTPNTRRRRCARSPCRRPTRTCSSSARPRCDRSRRSRPRHTSSRRSRSRDDETRRGPARARSGSRLWARRQTYQTMRERFELVRPKRAVWFEVGEARSSAGSACSSSWPSSGCSSATQRREARWGARCAPRTEG